MDRTHHARQTLRELDPTPRAKRAKRRRFAFAVLCAVTLGPFTTFQQLYVIPGHGLLMVFDIPLTWL